MAGKEILESTPVLNGTARVGDTVAVAVGEGRAGGGMRVGVVLEISGDPAFSGGFKRRYVKVRVEKSSGWSYTGMPYFKTYEDPSRMVKL